MINRYFTIFLLLCSILSYSQKFDVRGTKWNDTFEDVIKSEYPLKPSVKENEVSFDKVDVGENTLARIIYSFTNGKLSEVRYIVYGSSRFSNGVGTCKYQVPLYDKYIYTSFIFDALKAKGYQCVLGWNLTGGFPVKNVVDITGNTKDYYSNYSFDPSIMKKLDQLAMETKASRINFMLENTRNSLEVNFNMPLNSGIDNCNSKFFTNDYFNTYLWLIFTPNYAIRKEIIKSGF